MTFKKNLHKCLFSSKFFMVERYLDFWVDTKHRNNFECYEFKRLLLIQAKDENVRVMWEDWHYYRGRELKKKCNDSNHTLTMTWIILLTKHLNCTLLILILANFYSSFMGIKFYINHTIFRIVY